MPDTRFLEEYGLYRRFVFPDAHVWTIRREAPTIQRHCVVCKGERTWYEDKDVRDFVGTYVGNGNVYPHERRLLGNHVGFEYACSACHKDRVLFVVFFGPDTSAGGKRTQDYYVMKTGQNPPWSIEPPKELKTALGAHEPIFKKGAICESQGYGIGAFAYYRRIVESVIDELLHDIGSLLEPGDLTKFETALAQVKDSIVAQEKIAVVKELLPTFLRPGGMNPLGILHDALSVGIHALDDDDCLAFADGIRQSLAMLAKHIAIAKSDQDDYAKGITAVKDRLDKIKAKGK